MNQVETDRPPQRSTSSYTFSRRGVLGAIAAGAVATACRSPEDFGLGDPTGGGGSGGGGNTETGPDLDQVDMPERETTTTTVGEPEPPTTATDPGSNGGGDGAAPPTTSPDTTTTAAAPGETTTTAAPGETTTTAAPGETTTTAAPGETTTTTSFSSPVVLGENTDTIHVANRLTFGVTPGVIDQINTLGAGGYVGDQLARTTADPAAEEMLGDFQLLGLESNKQAFEQTREDDGRKRFVAEMTHSNVVRATRSENQLFEMVAQMWMDHFNVNLYENGKYRHLMLDYQENVIRPNSMGRFHDLLQAVIESPAMLVYLDNFQSNPSSDNGINENLGREILELHSLGIDEAGNQIYTEEDIRAAAFALTGWSIVTDQDADDFSDFLFRENYQHTEPISLLEGAWTNEGLTGRDVADSMIDFLAHHPSTARYVALKLARRFVSDTPSAELLDAAAQVYLDNDTAIGPTLQFVLTSDEFSNSDGQKLRRPFESVMAMLRALNAEVPTDPTGDSARRIRERLERLGQRPWNWQTPDGYPEEATHWLNTSGLLNRWNLAGQLALNRVSNSDDGDKIAADYNAIRPESATVSELITNLGRQFGLGELPAEMSTPIAEAVRLDPADSPQTMNDEQLGDIAGLLFAHPLFQIR
jgi:uncharacterized protein (DUF1800 family)